MKGLAGSRQLTMVLSGALVLVIALGLGAGYLVGSNRVVAEPVGPTPSASAPAESDASNDSATPSSETTEPQVPNTTVALSSTAKKHTRAKEVQQLIQRYFDGINSKDFDAWSTTVTTDQAPSQFRAKWLTDYSTTIDYNITIVALAESPFRVRMTFNSNQALKFAPPDMQSTCIRWDVTYELHQPADRLLVGGSYSNPDKTLC